MTLIDTINSFDNVLAETSLVLAFFWGNHCSVCHALKPRIEELLSNYYPEILFVEIKTEEQPELAVRYSVFTVPAIMFFVEGKEYIREARTLDMSLLQLKLNKIITLYKG